MNRIGPRSSTAMSLPPPPLAQSMLAAALGNPMCVYNPGTTVPRLELMVLLFWFEKDWEQEDGRGGNESYIILSCGKEDWIGRWLWCWCFRNKLEISSRLYWNWKCKGRGPGTQGSIHHYFTVKKIKRIDKIMFSVLWRKWRNVLWWSQSGLLNVRGTKILN